MQSTFDTFLQLGFGHILAPGAYDHILFVIALCAVYTVSEWRKVAVLVTAFTIGHSLTLALASLDIIRFPSDVIEFLIPVTILLTAVYNVAQKEKKAEKRKGLFQLNYILALAFGLIHGMGFSNFFRSSLMPGEKFQLVSQLLAFNIGVELGQLAIVASILATSWLVFNYFKTKQREWVLFVSGAAAGVAFVLMLNTKFW
ncbi:MAG TPA: HupE/UreJ family protein [Bacteroidetes bacterium]|nr:HupE/UreJ family protein [Bacteroidota bacterium]